MNLASLAEKNLAEFGEYDRLVFEGRTFTNRELHDASCRFAQALLDLGCRDGDKVVLMMPNSPEVFVTYPAVWRAGLVVIPVLFLLEPRELAYIVENSRAKVVVTSPEVYPKVMEGLREHGDVRVVVTGPGAPPPGALSFDELVAKSRPLTTIATRSGDEIATILYTSGTTGKPKGVIQTHKNLHANAQNGWNSMTTRDRSEVSLLVLPLAHTFGLSVLVAGYLNGVKGILMRWFDAEGALALIERHKVAYMAGRAHHVRHDDEAPERRSLRRLQREALAGRRRADAGAAAPRVRAEVRRRDVRGIRVERGEPQRGLGARELPAQARARRAGPSRASR